VFLEEVALAGDFGVYHDRDAARASMVLAALARADGLPDDPAECTAAIYEEALGRMPELCDHVDRFRSLWADEDATLAASDAAFEHGQATIAERPDVDLAVVTVAEDAPSPGGHRFGLEWITGLHPLAVNNRTERITIARLRGRRYDVEQRYEGWVQMRSRRIRPRRDLAPLAARLQDEETGDATWSASSVGYIIPRLQLGEGQESSIAPDRFVELLTEHLRTAPPAWDPYAPR
jgi:hypothetical protein